MEQTIYVTVTLITLTHSHQCPYFCSTLRKQHKDTRTVSELYLPYYLYFVISCFLLLFAVI